MFEGDLNVMLLMTLSTVTIIRSSLLNLNLILAITGKCSIDIIVSNNDFSNEVGSISARIRARAYMFFWAEFKRD